MGNEVSSSPPSRPQMLSNSRNVSIADESTLSAVGGNVYNVSIDTVHNLESAPDGEFLIALHDWQDSDKKIRIGFWQVSTDLKFMVPSYWINCHAGGNIRKEGTHPIPNYRIRAIYWIINSRAWR